jgi:NAD+ kinase
MKTVGIFINPFKSQLKEKLPAIIKQIKSTGLEIICPEASFDKDEMRFHECQILPASDIPPLCDMIFCFGGDGTVLRTVQIVKNHETPILAVNVGGLGFLTEVLLENFETAFQSILSNEYIIEERLLLKGEIKNDPTPMYVLNEFTIEKGRSTRVIEVEVDINDNYFNDYVADGLIISTPTGSTGYSLSSGGPIVVPTNHCIILNPICPHSLTNRPVIIPSDSKIRTKIYTDYPQILISADNQDIREVPSRTEMSVAEASFVAKLVKLTDSDYFSLLRNKLSWGGDFRDKLRWHYKR